MLFSTILGETYIIVYKINILNSCVFVLKDLKFVDCINVCGQFYLTEMKTNLQHSVYSSEKKKEKTNTFIIANFVVV